MATLEQLEDGLVKADAAGNTEDAKVFADEIRRMRGAQVEPPSDLAVAGQAALKGAASIPDAILNTPANLGNLAQMAYATGRPEVAEKVELFEQPNLIRRGLESVGAISPEREPKTAGQRVLDRAVQTGVNVAIAPAQGIRQGLANVATGAMSGAAAQMTKEATGSDLAAFAVGVLTPMVTRSLYNVGGGKPNVESVNRETLSTAKEAREAGYVIPPTMVKDRGTTNLVESVAGVGATKNAASLRNQEITDRLAAKSLGLPENTALTPTKFQELYTKAGEPYEAVKALKIPETMGWFKRFHEGADSLVEQWKQSRADARALWRKATGDPSIRQQAQEADALTASLEQDLTKIAAANGKTELVQQMKDASKQLAKIHSVEDATNPGTFHVSAQQLGRDLANGKPLTDSLKTIARFASAFPHAARNAENIAVPHASGTNALVGAMGVTGAAASGDLRALAVGGLPLLRGPARNLALSEYMQRRLLGPVSPMDRAYAQSALAGRSILEAQ